jgi:transposase-like protein
MIMQVLHCPYCQGTDIVKHGLSPEGKQRYRCRACREGRGRTFLLEYIDSQKKIREAEGRVEWTGQ